MVTPAQDARERVSRLLEASALMTGAKVSEDALAIYLLGLGKDPGYEEAFKALMSLFSEMKPGRGFPSIEDIRVAAKPPEQRIDKKELAMDASAKAIGAVSKFGWANPERAKEYMGDLAWRAVDRIGGWTTFCNTLSSENATTMQAQLRDLCSSIVAMDKAGVPDPDQFRLSQSEESKAGLVGQLVGELVSKTDITITEKKCDPKLEQKIQSLSPQ